MAELAQAIETPAKGRGDVSIMTVSPTAVGAAAGEGREAGDGGRAPQLGDGPQEERQTHDLL